MRRSTSKPYATLAAAPQVGRSHNLATGGRYAAKGSVRRMVRHGTHRWSDRVRRASSNALATPGDRIGREDATVRAVLVVALVAGLLVGCAPKEADWNRYPGLRESVLLLAEEKDCAGLKETADLLRLDEATARDRWGSGNGPLVEAIEAKARVAGCDV